MNKENKTMQRVIITPKLDVSIVTKSGHIEEGKEKVPIEGEFIIDAESVALLTAALTGKSIIRAWHGERQFIIADDAVKKLVEDLDICRRAFNEQRNKLEEQLSRVTNERRLLESEVTHLRESIKRFNKTRRPWERKLIIPDRK